MAAISRFESQLINQGNEKGPGTNCDFFPKFAESKIQRSDIGGTG